MYGADMAEFRVAFVAHDFDSTLSFFTDVMDLELVRMFDTGGPGAIISAAGGQIEIFGPDTGRGEPGVTGVMLAWQVDDAAGEHARLSARGVGVQQAPIQQPWGHLNFRIEGPDGLTITLYEIVVPQ